MSDVLHQVFTPRNNALALLAPDKMSSSKSGKTKLTSLPLLAPKLTARQLLVCKAEVLLCGGQMELCILHSSEEILVMEMLKPQQPIVAIARPIKPEQQGNLMTSVYSHYLSQKGFRLVKL